MDLDRPAAPDDADADAAPRPVLLFRDHTDILVQGHPDDVARLAAELMLPRSATRPGSDLRQGAVDAAAVAASGGALLASSAELLRPTAESMAKIAEFGKTLDANGAMRGWVTRPNGRIAAQLSMESVTFGPQQALALQSAAVTLALRTAIANVEEAVAAVDAKVTEVLARDRSRQIGEIVGLQAKLSRLSEETVGRQRLLAADWDSVASAGPQLEQALASLRALAAEKISSISTARGLPDRVDSLESTADDAGLPTILRLIQVAEDGLLRWEHLRVQRVRDTDSEHVESALQSARATLEVQRQADRSLIETAQAALNSARDIKPLEYPRFRSISQTHRLADRLSDAIDAFSSSTRADLPQLARVSHRPTLQEARTELAARVGDGRRAAGRGVLKAGRGARKIASRSTSRAVERRRGKDEPSDD